MVDEVPGPVAELPVEPHVPGVGNDLVALQQVRGRPEDGVVHFVGRDPERECRTVERKALRRLVFLCPRAVLPWPMRKEVDESFSGAGGADARPAGVGDLPVGFQQEPRLADGHFRRGVERVGLRRRAA